MFGFAPVAMAILIGRRRGRAQDESQLEGKGATVTRVLSSLSGSGADLEW